MLKSLRQEGAGGATEEFVEISPTVVRRYRPRVGGSLPLRARSRLPRCPVGTLTWPKYHKFLFHGSGIIPSPAYVAKDFSMSGLFWAKRVARGHAVPPGRRCPHPPGTRACLSICPLRGQSGQTSHICPRFGREQELNSIPAMSRL